MHTRIILGLVLLTAASVAKADGDDLSASRVFELASPSIVVVEAHDKEGAMVASGSGVVIAKGVVVSNCHVFTKADTAIVRYRQASFPAALQYGDAEHDLCSFTVNGLPAPSVRMNLTSALKVGEAAFAIGAPEGLELTLSGGLISSLRKLPDGVVIQMTTPISPGSSGGGLFDGQARLIGITSYYMGEGQQLNFALPAEWINELPQRGNLKAGTRVGHGEKASITASTDALSEGRRAMLGGDYVRAFAIFEPLAKQGNASAQSGLGAMYGAGYGVPQDWQKSVQWYAKAAALGDPFAQDQMGYAYDAGRGVGKDHAQAVAWYARAAAQGQAHAQLQVATAYTLGDVLTQDYAKAAMWFRKAADQNELDAATGLGFLYFSGLGVGKDLAEAVRWFRKDADRGEALAQTSLGTSYYVGAGVPQDYVQAAAWYRKAAEQGYGDAQSRLGDMYVKGSGTTQNYGEAVVWFRKAADQGDAHAQNALGAMYQFGLGVPQDSVVAYSLYNLSAALDSSSQNPAATNRGKVMASLSLMQVEAGQTLTRQMQNVGVRSALNAYPVGGK